MVWPERSSDTLDDCNNARPNTKYFVNTGSVSDVPANSPPELIYYDLYTWSCTFSGHIYYQQMAEVPDKGIAFFREYNPTYIGGNGWSTWRKGPQIWGLLEPIKTYFCAKSILKSDRWLNGYVCGFSSTEIVRAPYNDWRVYLDKIHLESDEILVITGKSAADSVFCIEYKNSEAVAYHLVSPDSTGKVVLWYPGSDLMISTSYEDGKDGVFAFKYKPQDYTFDTPEIILESDPDVNSNLSIYRSFKNSYETDLTTWDNSCFVYSYGRSLGTRVVDKVCLTSNSERNVTLYVGFVDQNSKFVISNSYGLHVNQGENEIDVSSMNIVIPAGYSYAMNVEAGESCLNFPLGTSQTKYYGYFNSDVDNVVHSTNNTPLFTAVVYYLSNDLKPLELEIRSVKTLVESQENNNTITGYDGKKYRLSVDANHNLVVLPVIPSKIVCIGNSICMHGIREEVGWYCDDRGMAATRVQYDYVHRIVSYIQSINANAQLAEQWNFAKWETASSNRSQFLPNLDSHLSPDTDLVTVQLSENVSNLTTLEQDYVDLVNYIRSKSPRATVVLIGDCFRSTQKDSIKKAAASRCGALYADVAPYWNVSGFYSSMGTVIYKSDGTTFTVTNSGVAGHPGDIGMRCIAQTTLRTLLDDDTIVLTDNYT